MSASKQKKSTAPAASAKGGKGTVDKTAYRIPEGSSWGNAWKAAAAVGVIGLIASFAGYSMDHERFAFSYLFAFFAFLTLPLGGLFFVLVERLTSAGWSVTTRRTAEFFASGSPVFIVLFLPLLLCLGTLYPWLHGGDADLVPAAHAQEEHPSAGEGDTKANAERQPAGLEGTHDPMPASHAAAHAEPGVHGEHHADPEEVQEEEVLAKKAGWLNKTGFLVRAVIYFLVWAWLGITFFNLSTKQDATKDPSYTVKAQRLAPVATMLFGLTLTGAAFDWLMSLLPTWYSTIFGVTVFAGSVVAMYATLIVTTMALNNAGYLKNAVNVEHYHDLGKLLFGFMVFWAYVSFAQFMLIWYAAIPEEVTFYHHRWDVGPWKTISLIILFFHFVIPFFVILSRNTKRRLPVLRIGALVLLATHVLEIYWFVMPYYANGEASFHWLDVACFLGVGGVYLAIVLNRMTKHPLIPVGDPRLSRALTFENA